MKKFTSISVIFALAAISSCIRVENPLSEYTDSEVMFSRPVMSPATSKAAVTGSLTTYPEEENFVVYAFYSDGDFDGWVPDKGSIFMNEVETSYDSGVNGWKPIEHSYYWPKNGKLTFAAFSPAAAKKEMTYSYADDGFTFRGFSVKHPQNESEKQYDLLYSERSMNKISSTGGVTYNGADLNFRHALCNVRFKFRSNFNYDDGNSLKIRKVELLNVYTKGDFKENVATSRPAVYSSDPKWSGQSESRDYTAAPDGLEQTVTNETADLENGYDLILMPQDFDHGSNTHLCIQVTYDDGAVKGKVALIDLVNGFDSDGDGVGDSYFNDGVKEIKAWEAGKRYIYTMTFGRFKILFTPTVDPWNDVEDIPEDF